MVVQAAVEEEEVEPQGLEIHRLLVPLKVKMVDLVVDLDTQLMVKALLVAVVERLE